VEIEVVLQRVGRVGVGGWNRGGVGSAGAAHGRGEPALTVVYVAIPEDGFGDSGWCGDSEGEIAAWVEGCGWGVVCGEDGAGNGGGETEHGRFDAAGVHGLIAELLL